MNIEVWTAGTCGCILLAFHANTFKMTPTLQEAWSAFKAERAVTLCPTSLIADYRQMDKWLARCPITDLKEGRQVMAWVLGQKPVKSSRRVAMYIKSLYRWVSSEDIAYLERNPITTFRMPKPPQTDEEVIVIPRNETSVLMAALEAKQIPGEHDGRCLQSSCFKRPCALVR